MTIPTDKILHAFRVGVVATSLLALLVCGGSAVGHQVRVAPATVDDSPVSPDLSLVEVPAGDSDDAGRQMDTGQSGRTGTAAYYMSGVLAKTGNDDSRFRRGEPVTTPHLIHSDNPCRLPLAIATPAHISSSLGRQFTLVGAKPSGTS